MCVCVCVALISLAYSIVIAGFWFLASKDWDGSSENASPNPSDVEALALRIEDGALGARFCRQVLANLSSCTADSVRYVLVL